MGQDLRCELISWHEIDRLCRRLAMLIQASAYAPEMVIAIGRGGYVPARLVCDALDMMALTSFKIEHYYSGSDKQPRALIRFPLCTQVQGLRVLIVDDVNDSGDTLQLAVEHVSLFQPCEIRTAVMHDKRVTHFEVDYCARQIVKWRWLIYPWAVNEDIRAFVQRLSPAPASLDEIRQGLARHFNIRISRRLLAEINAIRRLC
jgi:hypoxanthine phosphoribosyltransferase